MVSGFSVTAAGQCERPFPFGSPVFAKFTPRNFDIVDALVGVAKEVGRTPAEVALNWVTHRPGVSSTIIGATKPEQLESNLKALDFSLPAALTSRLEEASRPETVFPYLFFTPAMQAMITGGTTILAEPRGYRVS